MEGLGAGPEQAVARTRDASDGNIGSDHSGGDRGAHGAWRLRRWRRRQRGDGLGLRAHARNAADDGRAKYTPHGAFQLPDQDPSAPPRESIETRTFLVIEAT